MTKRIKVERLNHWLTLGANIGVVLGLVILIIEVRQNANLTRAALEAGKNNRLAAIELNISSPAMSAVWIKSLRSPEKMNDVEIRMVEASLVSLMLQWDNMFKMQDSHLVSQAKVEQHIRNSAPFYFGSTFAKHWWQYEKRGWEGTQMFAIANPIIEAIDERFLVKRLDELHIDGSLNSQTSQKDPATVSPEFYKVLLDNEAVRIVEYSLPPGSIDNPHTHPPKFMYVLDGGQLQITPEGQAPFISEEVVGHSAWSPARALHTAENTGDTKVRILLVEPKQTTGRDSQ
jgi:quercetin dioxygenase-like cupin family protein